MKMKSEFKKYRRTQIAEMRPVNEHDVKQFHQTHGYILTEMDTKVSISEPDIKNGSPKIGDMIARNPKNHNDQWLVAKQYFEDNFEPMQ